MPLPFCQCCQARGSVIEAPYRSITVRLCLDCFNRMRSFLRTDEGRDALKEKAKAECEIEKLQYWWNLGEAVIDR